MRKYLILLKTSIVETMSYRGTLTIWVLNSLFWMGAFPFVWWNIYGNNDEIGGMAKSTMLTYFFLMPIFDSLLTSWAYDNIERDVKDGGMSGKLMQPISYIAYVFFNERGWLIVRFFLSLIIMGVIYFFAHDYIVLPSLSLSHLWLFAVIPLSMTLYFTFCILIGFSAFFTTKTSWFEQGWWMIQNIACGYLAPIAFYPEWAQKILAYTPFPLLIQTPILISLNQLTTEEILRQIFIGVIWMIILVFIAISIWKKGIRQLESVGI